MKTVSVTGKGSLVSNLRNQVKQAYSPENGWKVYNRFNWSKHIHDFVAERHMNGRLERMIVEVNVADSVSKDSLAKLASMAKRLNLNGEANVQVMLAVYEGTDVSAVEGMDNIRIVSLDDFEEEELPGKINCRVAAA